MPHRSNAGVPAASAATKRGWAQAAAVAARLGTAPAACAAGPVAAVASLAARLLAAAATIAAWLLVAPAAVAAPGDAVLERGDWVVACDNTRTCRAAGYQSDAEADALPVSVLLTRKAGANEPVRGTLAIGDGDESTAPSSPPTLRLAMRVGGRGVGTVVVDRASAQGTLSAAQVGALVAAVTSSADDGVVEWQGDGRRWRLSARGANAALLRMDDAQRRVGTRGAMLRKGERDDSGVLPALPAPEVRKAALVPPKPADATLAAKPPASLVAALRESVRGGDCDRLEETAPRPLEVVRLGERKLLVSTPCWLAAYNAGSGFWVVDDAPPWRPVLVTASGNGHDGGEITSSHKGRGVGDCVWTEAWTWNGTRFVPSAASSGGLCRGVAPGGPWEMPTLVTRTR